MATVDDLLAIHFPNLVACLRKHFGKGIHTSIYHLDLNENKEIYTISVNGENIGQLERIFSEDGKKPMSKNAAIKVGTLPVETNFEMINLIYSVEEGERKDNYKHIPFP